MQLNKSINREIHAKQWTVGNGEQWKCENNQWIEITDRKNKKGKIVVR